MSEDYRQYGGVLQVQGGAPLWDFGLRRDPIEVQIVEAQLARWNGAAGSFYDLAPHLIGYGRGKDVMLSNVARAVIGSHLQPQFQDRGTCVSRGAKRACDYLQCLQIHCGAPQKFSYISHAYIYGTCREDANQLSNQDGAVGAWAAASAIKSGQLRNEDCNDDDNKDALAVQWGARGVPGEFRAVGKLHLVRKVVPIKSFDEARDFLCSGMGAITVASMVGYEGQRNSDGIVRRRGQWAHQMMFSGYRSDMDCLLQEQSWGPENPQGPLVMDQPSYSFWTTRDDATAQIREGDTWGFCWLNAWPNDPEELTWRP